jgi:hypothetical protein
VKFLEQQQEAVLADATPGQVKSILDGSWVVATIALDRKQIRAGRDDHIGRATQFDELIGRVAERWIEQDLVDEQFGPRGGHRGAKQAQADPARKHPLSLHAANSRTTTAEAGHDSGLDIFVTLNKYLQIRGKSKREQEPGVPKNVPSAAKA